MIIMDPDAVGTFYLQYYGVPKVKDISERQIRIFSKYV